MFYITEVQFRIQQKCMRSCDIFTKSRFNTSETISHRKTNPAKRHQECITKIMDKHGIKQRNLNENSTNYSHYIYQDWSNAPPNTSDTQAMQREIDLHPDAWKLPVKLNKILTNPSQSNPNSIHFFRPHYFPFFFLIYS